MCFAKCFPGINKDVEVTLIGGKQSAYQSLMEEEIKEEELQKESEGEAAGGSGIRPFVGSFEEEPISFVASGSNRLETGNRVVGWGDPGPRASRDRRVIYEDERLWFGGRDVDGGIEFRVGGAREEERAGRSRPAAPSRENLSALLHSGNRLPPPPESKTYCYWSNLGLVKENVVKSMFVTAEVPEGVRPTMSRVRPEDLNSPDHPSTPLNSPSTLLGSPLGRASSSLSSSRSTQDEVPAGISTSAKKKKNLVTKAADKFMKIVRKKH